MKGMVIHPTGTTDAVMLLREGWALLVEQLGVQKATEFAILLERGKGDTVEDITRYWGDLGIDEMHSQVLSWKQQQSQGNIRHQA